MRGMYVFLSLVSLLTGIVFLVVFFDQGGFLFAGLSVLMIYSSGYIMGKSID